MAAPPLDDTTLLDGLMPAPDHRTLHGRAVDAPVERVAAAIRETSLHDAPLARGLVALRTAGRSLRGTRVPFVRTGDVALSAIPLGESPHEVVLGYVGRPWPGGEPFADPPADRDGFVAHVPTDAVKVATSVRAVAAAYGTLVVTETRIQVGPEAARAFGRYWLVVRPGSDLVRRSLLRAVARRAEAATG